MPVGHIVDRDGMTSIHTAGYLTDVRESVVGDQTYMDIRGKQVDAKGDFARLLHRVSLWLR